ncbi:hypothetical protein THAOC_28134 [Thalassiosira oceanica]|uniref:Uncharacterized protein n=1 Tax=Thalassiosira oceanica TaxID=159749 RepID=K0RFR5_THAOC|nr:hypothetical protein THAOC_28134 [Thalassiosira oceanica]|eukprot:EJK52573.1 hypothetical protein THAOC_28134 [Thalassiosira oceanica]
MEEDMQDVQRWDMSHQALILATARFPSIQSRDKGLAILIRIKVAPDRAAVPELNVVSAVLRRAIPPPQVFRIEVERLLAFGFKRHPVLIATGQILISNFVIIVVPRFSTAFSFGAVAFREETCSPAQKQPDHLAFNYPPLKQTDDSEALRSSPCVLRYFYSRHLLRVAEVAPPRQVECPWLRLVTQTLPPSVLDIALARSSVRLRLIHLRTDWMSPLNVASRDPGPADGALPPHFLLDTVVSRPPLVQASGAERVAAGQAQRVLRILEAYPARLFVIGDDGSTAIHFFGGHADFLARRMHRFPMTDQLSFRSEGEEDDSNRIEMCRHGRHDDQHTLELRLPRHDRRDLPHVHPADVLPVDLHDAVAGANPVGQDGRRAHAADDGPPRVGPVGEYDAELAGGGDDLGPRPERPGGGLPGRRRDVAAGAPRPGAPGEVVGRPRPGPGGVVPARHGHAAVVPELVVVGRPAVPGRRRHGRAAGDAPGPAARRPLLPHHGELRLEAEEVVRHGPALLGHLAHHALRRGVRPVRVTGLARVDAHPVVAVVAVRLPVPAVGRPAAPPLLRAVAAVGPVALPPQRAAGPAGLVRPPPEGLEVGRRRPRAEGARDLVEEPRVLAGGCLAGREHVDDATLVVH